MKKFFFFWCIFNVIGYASFLLEITPSIETSNGSYVDIRGNKHIAARNEVRTDYFITPKYIHGWAGDQIIPNCSNCHYAEKENFWPFHKFTYVAGTPSLWQKGFVGIWGYYGHYEFLVYIILPLLTMGLIQVYKRFIQ